MSGFLVSEIRKDSPPGNADVSSPDVRDSATLAKHKLDLPDSYDKSLDHSQQKLNRRATRKQFLPFSKFEFQGEDELKEEIIIEHHDVDQRDPLAHDTVSSIAVRYYSR
ncbi:uncharacterized protein [Anabrus simplex]|uniref:uncharacterized protein isoform X3 n=1 Tax=Anabrus simplex TaxID=316456 RepID=UPI0035A3AD28